MKSLIGILIILAGLGLIISVFMTAHSYIYAALGGSAGGLLIGIGWYYFFRKR